MSTLKASVLVSATSALNLVVRFLSLAILARLLVPEDFGLVAMAMAIQSMLAIVAQLDFRDALIQSRTISRGHVVWSWRLLAMTAIASYGGLVALGPFLEAWVAMEGLAAIMWVVALCLIPELARAPLEALLIRRRKVGSVAMANVWGYAIGFATVGIALALVAPSAMALAWAYVALEVVKFLYMVWVYRRLPSSDEVYSDYPSGGVSGLLRDLTRFAFFGTLNRFFSTANTKLDNLIVGSLLGAGALGFYSRAYSLAATPMDTLLGMTIRSVIFPALAGMQDDAERFRRAVARANALAATVIMPLGLTMLVLAPEAIAVVFGPGWEAAVFPFQCLGLALGFRFGPRLTTAVGRALGKQRTLFFMNAALTVVLVGMVSAGATLGGLNGASLAIIGNSTLHWFVSAVMAARLSQMPMGQFFAALWRPAAFSALYVLLLFGFVTLLRGGPDIAIVTILVGGAGAAICMTALVFAAPGAFLGEWERVQAAKAVARIPPRRLGLRLAHRIDPTRRK